MTPQAKWDLPNAQTICMRVNVSSSDCHAFAIMLEISAASTCSLVHEVITKTKTGIYGFILSANRCMLNVLWIASLCHCSWHDKTSIMDSSFLPIGAC